MEWTDSQRIAAAAERMADRLEDIDHTLTAISRVSGALEEAYQRGRADAAKVVREMASEYQQVQLATAAAALTQTADLIEAGDQ